MSVPMMNLARRHFVNSRPVTRLAVGLWLLSVLALAANVWLYQSYYQGSGARARRLAEIEQALVAERNAIAERQAVLEPLRLAQQNATVDFLNRKISERAFSWSRLFERLGEVMPDRVRLTSLGQDEKPQRKAGPAEAEAPQEKVVHFQISGQADEDGAHLAFVDALFEHPNFRDPNLLRESQRDGDYVSFDVSVDYLPARPAASPAGEGAP